MDDGWTLTALAMDLRPGANLPANAMKLTAAEVSVINQAAGARVLDPVTLMGVRPDLDCYIYSKGAETVTIWTDAELLV
jgi:hypothetical protein